MLEEIRDAVMGLTIPEALTTELEAACKTAGFPTELTADMGEDAQRPLVLLISAFTPTSPRAWDRKRRPPVV